MENQQIRVSMKASKLRKLLSMGFSLYAIQCIQIEVKQLKRLSMASNYKNN